MSDSIGLRRATTSDQSSLSTIEACCFDSDRISPRQMHYLLSRAKAVTYIAVYRDTAVGYSLWLIPRLPRPARLYSLAVLPQWRSQHLARRLCDHAMTELRRLNYTHCRLEVRRSQITVKNFYLSLGFSPLVELPGYYEDREDALRMECMLIEPAFDTLEH